MSVIDRPVFIVGVDHSGTTILYRMMARHRDLAWFSQYSLRGGDFPGRSWVPLHGWANRAGRSMFPFQWQKAKPRYLPEPREGAGIWRRLIPRTEGFLYDSDFDPQIAERTRSAVQAELDAWQLDRMLIKIPYLTRAMQLMDRIFPDALFIHIVRDGRAVALSNQKRFEQGGRAPTDALRASARIWIETLEYVEALRGRLGSRLMTMRYEAFCKDVHGALREAFRFSQLPSQAADLEGIPTTLRSTNEKWLATCSPSDQRLLDQELAAGLKKWGYPLFGAGHAAVPAASAARAVGRQETSSGAYS
ncbi:MAG: sulfotransferase [Gemmatimonadales bacterium]